MNILVTPVLLSFIFLVVTGASASGTSQTQKNDRPSFECPDTPNCVSSLAKDPGKRVDPFPESGSPARSMEILIGIIRSMPRSAVRSATEERIVAEFRSILGFVDDVLFAVDPGREVIHVRSASRTGTWDLGVNRRRVERIRKRYMESAGQPLEGIIERLDD